MNYEICVRMTYFTDVFKARNIAYNVYRSEIHCFLYIFFIFFIILAGTRWKRALQHCHRLEVCPKIPETWACILEHSGEFIPTGFWSLSKMLFYKSFDLALGFFLSPSLNAVTSGVPFVNKLPLEITATNSYIYLYQERRDAGTLLQPSSHCTSNQLTTVLTLNCSLL